MNPLSLDEAVAAFKRFRAILLTAALTLATGTIVFHLVEKWRYLDAFYFSAVSLLTVGYGDFVPKTDLGKLLTVLYLFIGIGIIAALVNNLLKGIMARREVKRSQK